MYVMFLEFTLFVLLKFKFFNIEPLRDCNWVNRVESGFIYMGLDHYGLSKYQVKFGSSQSIGLMSLLGLGYYLVMIGLDHVILSSGGM